MNYKNVIGNWKVVRLGRVADICLGKTPHRKVKSYWDNGIIPLVKIQDMTEKFIRDTSEKITYKAFKEIFHNNLIPEGTLLMSFKLTIGRTAFLEIDAVHNEAIVSIFPNPNLVDKNYLFYLLPALNYSELTSGAAKGETLNKEKIKNLLIPLPPFPEQKRIVGILNLAEELINKQKSAIALIDKILMAKFLEMFGDPTTNPKGWEVKRLGEVTQISPSRYEVMRKSNCFFIPMELIPQGEKFFTDYKVMKFKEIKSGISVSPGDLLIAKITPCFENGKIGFVPKIPTGFFMATTEVHPIRSKGNNIDLRFLYYLLRHKKIKEYLKNQMTGTSGRKRIPQKALVKLQIPLPPIHLQQQFAQIVEKFEEKRKEMQNTLETLESLFKILQKKAFTGELTAEWREKQKIDWELPKITERQAILLALLYYSHIVLKKPAMLTFAMKEAFLLQKEAGLNLGYEFIPYKYGPFSKEVYEDIEKLEKNLLVEKVKPSRDMEKTEVIISKDFKDWVEKLINKLPEKHKNLIQSYVQKYGTLSYKELINYVYYKYPKFIVKSKGKRRII